MSANTAVSRFELFGLKRDARKGAYKPLELAAGSVAQFDPLGGYGTVILRISPMPTGGGPKPTFETWSASSGPKVIAMGRKSPATDLRLNNHRARHAQVVMQRADVRKSSSVRKSDAETCHAERRLREPKPFLGRRDDEPRVSAVGSGIDDGVPGPILIDSHVGGRRRRVSHRFGPKGNGMRRDWILVIPLDSFPGMDLDSVVGKAHDRNGVGAACLRRDRPHAGGHCVR
jgi:hypothetical protein